MKQLTLSGFFIRFIFALVLVLATYNPTQYNLASWLISSEIDPLKGVISVAIAVVWIIYIRATLRSIGPIVIALAATFFGFLVWLFIDLGWFNLGQVNNFTWVILLILAIILAIGMSWSHIRRRMSGQLDTDDVDNY